MRRPRSASSATPPWRRCPNLPARDAPDEDTVLRDRRRGRRHGPRPSGARRPADRHGAGRAAVRIALRLPARRPRDARVRAGPVRAREAARTRASSRWCRRCSCASGPCTGPASCPTPSSRSTRLPDDDLYLVGTSEVALASLHDDEILAGEDLPLRYAGFSTCFRREAGAAGKDTRGIFRVHQFDKVEMFSFVAPDEGPAEHERLLAIEESILSELAIPYRVVAIAVDDLGASAAKKYDCEAWLPGQGRYRELTSTLKHHRLPGPAARHPLPPGRRPARARPHAERYRGGRGADDHRAARERAARRRLGGATRRAGRLWRAGGPPAREQSLASEASF